MIYEMLLIQDGGMSIPNGHFKRIKPSRDGPMPLSCSRCSKLFASDKDPLHLSHDKHYNVQHSRMSTSSSSILPELPAASPSILCTCRLVHLEALPILYTKNTFCFSDPATASTFCWKADRTQAILVQEIVIRLLSPLYRVRDPWLKYAAKKSGLAQDFPHLRRMTVELELKFTSSKLKCWSDAMQRPVLKSLAQEIRGLSWLHVDY